MSAFTRLAAAAALCLAASAAHAAQGCTAPQDASALANAIATGLNAQRAAHGLHPLSYNPDLSQAAMVHACDMAVRGFFAHQGSDGSDHSARIRRVGYRDCTSAENLAWGYPLPQQIIDGWMDSPSHRRNMLLNRVNEFGIAIVDGARGPIWVLEMARPGC